MVATLCQEVCPANRDLNAGRVDPRVGSDSRHHASHKHLDGLERTPELMALLAPNQPEIIRRNAAIALANIGKKRKDVSKALKQQLKNASSGLQEYFIWAIKQIEGNET